MEDSSKDGFLWTSIFGAIHIFSCSKLQWRCRSCAPADRVLDSDGVTDPRSISQQNKYHNFTKAPTLHWNRFGRTSNGKHHSTSYDKFVPTTDCRCRAEAAHLSRSRQDVLTKWVTIGISWQQCSETSNVFSFQECAKHLAVAAPLLFAVLGAASSKMEPSNSHVVTSAACLLKSRHPQMSRLPHDVSIALYQSSAKKRTYTRLIKQNGNMYVT